MLKVEYANFGKIKKTILYLPNNFREIYYQEISVVRNRDLVDCALEIICVLLNSPPWELGIMASSKGLVAGALLIKNGNDDIVDCNVPGGIHYVASVITSLQITLITMNSTFRHLNSVLYQQTGHRVENFSPLCVAR